MSDACPWKPPEGWCRRIRALGSAKRMPVVPAVRSSDPIEAASPMQSVDTAGLMNWMVS
ncbi:hypothetical protein D3C83_70940 [compost metagenome]